MLFVCKSQPFCSKVFQEFPRIEEEAFITESSYSSEEEILSVSLDHTANAVDMSKFKNKIFAHMEIAK